VSMEKCFAHPNQPLLECPRCADGPDPVAFVDARGRLLEPGVNVDDQAYFPLLVGRPVTEQSIEEHSSPYWRILDKDGLVPQHMGWDPWYLHGVEDKFWDEGWSEWFGDWPTNEIAFEADSVQISGPCLRCGAKPYSPVHYLEVEMGFHPFTPSIGITASGVVPPVER